MRQWFEQSLSLQFLRDFLDVFVVAFIVYYVLKLIRGTRAVYMLIGLSVAVLVYVVSSVIELTTLNWILYHFLGSFLLIIVVLFQNEIRRALTRVGKTPLFSFLGPVQDTVAIDELIKTSISLSNKKIGALIVVERDARISDHVEEGIEINADVSKELLTSIFIPASPLHDGAVVIQNGRIGLASCVLPLTMKTDLDQDLGTRHRAAIGITEETDALVIVISEERGWISVAFEGKLIRGIDAMALRKIMTEQFDIQAYSKAQKSSDPSGDNEPEVQV